MVVADTFVRLAVGYGHSVGNKLPTAVMACARTVVKMLLQNFPDVAQVIISVAVMLLSGFLLTRLTKLLKLPNVTAYIIAGILLGPYCFKVVPDRVVQGMSFLADIALAFIAFGTGEFFRLSTLRRNGAKNIVITLFESLIASLVVFVVLYFIMRLPLEFSLVLGALAAATAPASTLMTIRQTGAKGDFVDTLLQVVALDDVVGLVAFSAAISVAMAIVAGSVTVGGVVLPIVYNIACLVLGGVLGWVLKLLICKPTRTGDNRLIIALAVMLGFCGVCAFLDVSPLLGCMAMGTVYMNVSDDDRLFKQLNYFSPPILLLFFVRSGINFDLGALVNVADSVAGVPLLVVGVVYFFVRILGKYGGGYLGCVVTKKDKRVRNYLGLALIPQAGVAIGLATLASRTLGGTIGSSLETIILASSVLYELIGPACAKLALYLSGSYSDNTDRLVSDNTTETATETASAENAPTTSTKARSQAEVDKLIDKIRVIRAEIPVPKEADDERAFDEAAEEYYAVTRRRQHK